MKYILSLVLIVATVIPAAKCDVYEASSSEDVNLFINDDPHKNRAIMFYDEIQEISQKGLHKRDDKIISIFLGKGEKNRLKEDWVDELKDEFNIMLVDTFKQENAEIVKELNVKETPYIVIFENHKTQFESIVFYNTFDKVKELLLKSHNDKTLSTAFKNGLTSNSDDGVKPKTVDDKNESNVKESSEMKIHHYPQYQSIHASISDKKDDKSKSTANPKLESPDKPKSTSESNTLEKKESCNTNGSSKPSESESPKKLEEEQALDDALKELNKALEKYEEAKKKVDNRINSIKRKVESSSSKIANSATSIPDSYSIYNSPTSYVSRMLNQNYANQYSQYKRGHRRLL